MVCNISNLAGHTCIAFIDLTNFYKLNFIMMSIVCIWSGTWSSCPASLTYFFCHYPPFSTPEHGISTQQHPTPEFFWPPHEQKTFFFRLMKFFRTPLLAWYSQLALLQSDLFWNRHTRHFGVNQNNSISTANSQQPIGVYKICMASDVSFKMEMEI